ncbi:MAG: hypothetical protein ACTSPC_06075, partial [Candidatus Heimdallarchaeota archaeon]
MSSKAFQYFVFLMDFDDEKQQVDMLLLPAKAKALRMKPLERAKLQFAVESGRLRPYKYVVLSATGSEY